MLCHTISLVQCQLYVVKRTHWVLTCRQDCFQPLLDMPCQTFESTHRFVAWPHTHHPDAVGPITLGTLIFDKPLILSTWLNHHKSLDRTCSKHQHKFCKKPSAKFKELQLQIFLSYMVMLVGLVPNSFWDQSSYSYSYKAFLVLNSFRLQTP